MDQQELTTTQRYMVCVLGSILPTVVEAYRLSMSFTMIELKVGQTYEMYLYGLLVRFFILIASAVLYCYFFADEENNKARLFFDGMAAPSMLLTFTMPVSQANNFFGL